MRGATPPLHPYAFMAWGLVKAEGRYLLVFSRVQLTELYG